MLHTETVEKRTLDLIAKLMADKQFGAFSLVGGTALSLQLGHRKSIDIDLFTTENFNAPALADHLTATYDIKKMRTITNGVFGFIDGIKIDLIAHQYPLINKLEIVEGIRMISQEDIAAMKLSAIYDNGTRLKDFVDIYALLENMSLEKMLNACGQKYPDINIAMVQKALMYHDDIDLTVQIDYIRTDIKWPSIKERLQKAFHNPKMTFGKLPDITIELMKKINKDQPGKGKRPRF